MINCNPVFELTAIIYFTAINNRMTFLSREYVASNWNRAINRAKRRYNRARILNCISIRERRFDIFRRENSVHLMFLFHVHRHSRACQLFSHKITQALSSSKKNLHLEDEIQNKHHIVCLSSEPRDGRMQKKKKK